MRLLLLLLPAAVACPTLAAATTSALDFSIAQVAIVRQGEHTTFSVSVNPLGDRQEFALVMPVPEVLERSQVRTLDGAIFANLDGFSGPRHVSDAGCPSEADTDTDADSDTDADLDSAAVAVEANYLVGDYEITILSATESAALGGWLDAHDYTLPDGADARLAEYIEGGSYFMAAKVVGDAALADGSPLPPLQVSYDSPMFSIPIRLATLNSPGEQDMIVYAITDWGGGDVGVANYPQFEVTGGCLWGDPVMDDFSQFYDERFTERWAKLGDAGWTVEYAGDNDSCQPCTSVNMTDHDLTELGFNVDESVWWLTRLHLRYTPAQADQDLTLYTSGLHEARTTSFADDAFKNYACIDAYCDGSVPGEGGVDTDPDAAADTAKAPSSGACGCQGAPTAPAAGALLAGFALVRRRR